MSVTIKTIDAFRNKHIPERFLSNARQSTLAMFDNQVCVCLKASTPAFHTLKYEIEDEIRAAFMARIDEWIRSFPTKGSWSVVSHGTTANSDYDFICTFGFVFVNYEDSENFLKNFIILDKLAN